MRLDVIYNDDCLERLGKIPDKSVDLIVTSPPYADNRKGAYQGVGIDEYVDWFLPISKEMFRVLKNRGSFVLNIKERTVNGGTRHVCAGAHIRNEKARLVMDGGICLA